jgi:hypothetical protein
MHRLLLCLVVAAVLTVPAAAVAKGGSPAPALPADFPSNVALPSGQLTGSTGASPNWSVGLLLDGGYPEVMASVHDFYLARGYSELGPTWMYRLTNGIYTITFVGRNHDHSATRTDVTIQVSRQ